MVFIPIPFKPQKALLRWLLHLHINFQLIPQRVYPVGVTDLRPYFTQIIGHNSVNVHRIPTKVGTQIRLNEPFKCAKFQPDSSTHSCFMADFANVRNEKKKIEEIKTKFCSLVSRKWLERFSSNLVCRLSLLAGTSLANLVPIG